MKRKLDAKFRHPDRPRDIGGLLFFRHGLDDRDGRIVGGEQHFQGKFGQVTSVVPKIVVVFRNERVPGRVAICNGVA
jgi:hypothetical protein